MRIIFGGGDIASAIKGEKITKEECDVRVETQVGKIIKKYKPKIVINCAGISNVQTIKGSSTKQWFDEIMTNLMGSYLIAKHCIENNVETMIFIASVAGLYGKSNHSGYSASKKGVISLVQSLGLEGHNAYAISPGRVDTSMREKDYPDEDKRTRLLKEEVAEVVEQCIDGMWKPGDNIIIRKRAYQKFIILDKGQPWKEEMGF